MDGKALRMAVRVAKVVRKDVMWTVNHTKGAMKTYYGMRMKDENEGKYGGGALPR